MATLSLEQLAGGTRLNLPRRVLPLPLRQFGKAAVILGAMLMAAGLSPLIDWTPLLTYDELMARLVSISGALHTAAFIAGAFAVAFGLLLLRGRSCIDCLSGKLIVEERLGPLRWRRHFDLTTIEALTVEVLPFNFAQAPSGAGLGQESITILVAATTQRGRRVLSFGYPAPLLEQVITEIRRRSSWAPIRRSSSVLK